MRAPESSVYHHKFKNVRWCIYCGEPATCRDHVMPLAVATRLDLSDPRVVKRFRSLLVTVPACHDCNAVVSDIFDFKSILDKRRLVKQLLAKRLAKQVAGTSWTRKEAKKKLKRTLRTTILEKQARAERARRRLWWPNVDPEERQRVIDELR